MCIQKRVLVYIRRYIIHKLMHTYSYIDTYVHTHIAIYKLYTYANKKMI